MLLTKQNITQSKNHQYGAGVVTPFNFSISVRLIARLWDVISVISVTQKNVVAQQKQ
jgi:hypothetical protein